MKELIPLFATAAPQAFVGWSEIKSEKMKTKNLQD